MGSGETTVGWILTDVLGYSFFDSVLVLACLVRWVLDKQSPDMTIESNSARSYESGQECHLQLGAVEFLRKLLSEEKLKNIWHHVVHKVLVTFVLLKFRVTFTDLCFCRCSSQGIGA